MDAFHVHSRASLVVGDGGRILALLDEHAPKDDQRRAGALPATDLGAAVLIPGLVNAHAHLELSGLALEPSEDFGTWVAGVLEARARLQPPDYREALTLGARRLLATGTTTVGDFDSSGASEHGLGALGLRGRVYRELLDGDDANRSEAQIERLRAPWQLGPRLAAGLAPHAPHTASAALLAECAREAQRAGLVLSTHWAETQEEQEWLAHGSGPFASFLHESPGCSGWQRLSRAELVSPALSLVHGNHPEPGDMQRLARSGASLVHCPGSHAFFGRPRLPLEAWAASGLTLALGTDSAASNEDLDMRREMSLVRREYPGLRAASVFDWATRGGARALGMAAEVGDLAVGKWADFSVLDGAGMENSTDVIEALTSACPAVHGVWVEGRQV